MSKAPNDKKNLERTVKLRYAVQSGQSIQYMEIPCIKCRHTESQSFGFYANTGQGATDGGSLEQVNMFYTRQECQWKFLVRV